MSVEAKIKQLLEGKKAEQLTEEQMDVTADAGVKASANVKKDTSKSSVAAVAGDATAPMQGSSEKATFDDMEEDETNLGAKAAASVSKDTTLPTSKGDAKSVKTQAMEAVDVKSELNSIFGEELSEEFRTKATSIFEAAVIARVNVEMEKVTSKLEEQNQAQIDEFMGSIVEKVDSYLNYVVEQWMEENQVAVDSGLRTEISEEFISGMKKLFKESYIEVPEEKYDVLGDMSDKIDTLSSELNATIQENVELVKKFNDLKKQIVFEEQTKDLAATEAEKLKKLVEGVEFDSEDLYKEKISVIKENYFPKNAKTTPVPETQVLVEDSSNEAPVEEDGVMTKYVSAISRSIKSR
jgi:hypothetical protein